MIQEQDILEKLKNIIDPDLNQDIVSLGFVQNIQIQEGDVSLTIALTTPACPVKDQFQSDAKKLIEEIKGVNIVQITMSSLPKNTKLKGPEPLGSLNDVRSIIAISSCKGGVGKSTIAAQMAQELASRGFRVGLMDADIYGPSIPILFNLKNKKMNVDKQNRLIPVEKNNLKLMSFGFLLGDNPAVMRGPIVTRYIQQMLLNTDWGILDYLFIDLPPGTGDVHLTITQTIRLDGAVIITTPHNLSLIDVARGILMFEKVSVPILGIIENMSYFQSNDSDDKHYIFGQGGASHLKDRFGVSILSEIPILPQLAMNIENPVSNSYIMDAVDQTMRSLGKHSIHMKDIPNVYSDEKNITLNWSDGTKMTASNFDLRLNSQDALSVNEMTGQKLLKPEDINANIAATKVTPLGNYALSIEWND